MVLGSGGAPRFVRGTTTASSVPVLNPVTPDVSGANLSWSEAFGNVGIPNATSVNAVAVDGQDIYIGGQFSTLAYDAGIGINNVAMWDGHGWNALGSGSTNGVNGTVYALAGVAEPGGTPAVEVLQPSGSDLYVGGVFATANGVTVHSVAEWNGSGWLALGGGIQSCSQFTSPGVCTAGDLADGTVFAFALSGSSLYVGGYFNDAGGHWIFSIAKWSGSTWSSLGAWSTEPGSARSKRSR